MNQNVNLDLIPKFAVFGNLYFSQYDVGRTATINLLNGAEAYTIPVGATVKIQATKPSGLGFSETCTFSGNVVTVVSTETMTDEAGRIPCELRIEYNGEILGTANFTFNVERSPHPEGTTDGTADSVISQITVAFNYAMEQIENSGGLTPSIKNALLDCFAHVAWIDDQGQTYYDALVDAFYEVTGITLNFDSLLFNSIGSTQQLTATLVPSDSTAQIQWESSDTSVATVSSSGLVTSVADGNATITASVGEVSATCSVSVVEVTVSSLSAVLNASGHTFYVGDPVDDIKPYLTVTATYSDSTTATIPSGSYTLSGSLATAGENTITVSYEEVSTTVTVTAVARVLTSISAVYTQSGTVYNTDTLDSLKSDLVVTATYSDSSTATVPSADYTLSGTLTEGTSTITVSYGGKTATFDVTVSRGVDYTLDAFDDVTWEVGKDYNQTTGAYVDATNQVATDKFTVQDCLYQLTGSGATYPGLYVWDESDNYQGIFETTGFNNFQVLALPSKYTYAFHVYDANGTFVPSDAHYMPINNSANQTAQISIRLSDHLEEFTWQSGYGQIDITNILAEYGITSSNLGSKINRTSEITFISPSDVGNARLSNPSNSSIVTYAISPYQGAVYLIPRTRTATNLTNLKAFISANDPVLIINGEV